MTSTNQFVQQDQHIHTKTPPVFTPHSDDTQNKDGNKLFNNNDNNDLNVIEKDPKTPTAPEAVRRRSEIGVCPPAPRKAKSLAIKRKWSPDNQTNSTNNNKPSAYRLLDFTKEIESMYPPLLQANLGRKIKKARSN